MAISALLLLMPFVQLGVSYYGSIATLMTVLSLVGWRRQLVHLINARIIFKSFVILGMFYCLLSEASSRSVGDVLRIAREATIFLVMTGLIERFSLITPARIDRSVIYTIVGLSLAFLVLAVAQNIALGHQIYLGLPKSYFVQNDNTIPGALSLVYSRLRASGTFGEPSYFAFILISMFVMIMPLARRSLKMRATIGIIVLTGLLTRSLSFVIGLPAIASYTLLTQASSRQRIRLVVLFAIGAVLFYFFAGDQFSSRLSQGLSVHGDESIYVRIIGPFSILSDFLMHHPFGVSFSTLPIVLQPYASSWGLSGADILMNGILNALFCYGIFGIPLILLFLFSARDPTLRIYLLVCTSFNGALFAIDKFAVICLAVALYRASCNAVAARPAPNLLPAFDG